MFVEKRVKEGCRAPEICGPQPVDGGGKIKETAFSGQVESAQRAGDSKAFLQGCLNTVAVIHQQIGIKG